MSRFGFAGPTYTSQSPNVDVERAINLLPEKIEWSGGKSQYALYSTPGLKLRYNLGATAILGTFACRPNGAVKDRAFAVVQSGQTQALYELFDDYTHAALASIASPTSPLVTFAENGTQLAICSGGNIWVLNLSTSALTGPYLAGTVAMIGYCDGFGIALLSNSNKFQVSGLLDFTSWPGLGVAQVSEFPDNVISMIVNQRGIWFLGTKATVPYYNQGAINVPFLPVQGVYIENGCGAQMSTARLDNSIFWLDMNERGQGIARRANGYTPQRISHHGIETTWNSYPKISDAIGYAYEEAGHAYYVLYFPSGTGADGKPGAGATWAYDVSTGLWHERAFLRTDGFFEAHHSQNHFFAFGKHFVGDWSTGNIYQQSISFYDDNGSAIRRVRRCPHINTEGEWIYYPQLQIDLETGLGPQPPLTGPFNAPTSFIIPDQNNNPFLMRVKDDGTITVVSTTGTPGNLIIADNQVSNAAYKITFDSVNSLLKPIAVTFSTNYPVSVPMASCQGFLKTALFIANGLLQTTAPYAAPRGPQLSVRWSNDSGHTWSSYQTIDCGQAGEFKKRVVIRRLGRARTRTFEVSVSDAIPWRFVDAYLKAIPGSAPQPRWSKQMQETA